MGLKDAAIGSQGSSQESAIGSQESDVVDPTPPEEWMVEQRLAAKRAEEKMAAGCDGELFVAKRPKAARQIQVAEAEAAEEGKAKPAGTGKKTKLVRVEQMFIDGILKRHPVKPFVGMPEEVIQKLRPEENREYFRTISAKAVALMKRFRDEEEAILEQYHAKGYAEMEVEVKDDDEDVVAEGY